MVALYDKEGFQVLLHAIGDKAISMALNAFEYGGARPTALRAAGIASSTPRSLGSPICRAGASLASSPRRRRCSRIPTPPCSRTLPYAWPRARVARRLVKLYDDAGIVQAFGSDWGVFPFEPLPAIYCVVTRMTPDGTPPGGWYPADEFGRGGPAALHARRRLRELRRGCARQPHARQARGLRGPLEGHLDDRPQRDPDDEGAADGDGRQGGLPG